MASIRKLPNGKWQAQIAKEGVRKSKSFRNKHEAKDWANQTEHEISQRKDTTQESGNVSKIFDRFAREVSNNRESANTKRFEITRLEGLKNDPLGKVAICDLSSRHLAEFRDRRLRTVSGSTVNREFKLLSSVFTTAMHEWGWIDKNPCVSVSRPRNNPPRDRLISQSEIERLEYVIKYEPDKSPINVRQRIMHAFHFAIETGMRIGEISNMSWQDIDFDNQYVRLPKTKNGSIRDVPLSTRAIELLNLLNRNGDKCFDLNPVQTESNFRVMRNRAGISDLHFHDTRHEAITRLSKKLDVLALARMVGHRNIGMLQIYYNESASDIAKRLD